MRDEVLLGIGHDDERAIAGAFDDGWLLAQDEAPDASELPDLDEGEAACIRLALAQAEPCLVERASTALTRERGLPVAGTSAVSGVARQRGLIPSAPQVFAKLHAADYRICQPDHWVPESRPGRRPSGTAANWPGLMLHSPRTSSKTWAACPLGLMS